MINYIYNEEKELLEVVYSGLVTLEDLDVYMSNIMNNKKLPRNLYILTDARKAVYNSEKINYFSIVENMKNYLESYIFVKNAILHEKPVETAVSMIMESKVNINNYKQKVFYTKKAAIEWLKYKK